jgi:hypothetical protein
MPQRSIPKDVKRQTHLKLIQLLDQYYREAEEHEDDDVIRDTSAEGRINDFALYLYNTRFVKA